MATLNSLLDSKLKKKLLRALFAFPERAFYANELRDLAGSTKRTISKALNEFHEFDVVKQESKKRKKYFQINPYFQYYDELENLVSGQRIKKTDPVSALAEKIKGAKLVALTGVFTLEPHLEVDILIAGDKVSKKSLASALKKIEKFAGQEINYSLMDLDELRHRKNVHDRFLRDILDNNHIVVLNKLRDKSVFRR